MSGSYGKRDLERAAKPFHQDHWPQLLCGRCEQGTLSPKDGDSVNLVEAADSASPYWRNHDGWEPDWIYGYFHGVLRCSDTRCGEPTVVTGVYNLDYAPSTDEEYQKSGVLYAPFLRLQFAYPETCIMKIPDRCPNEVRERIEEAARLIWADPASAANRLRSAIEELLTAQKVPRTRLVAKKGGAQGRSRRRLTAHDRIELLKVKEPGAADLLEAVKWIGNSGSHESGMRVGDVLDGVALMEHALHELYDNRGKELAKMAKKINARKGPLPLKSNKVPGKRNA